MPATYPHPHAMVQQMQERVANGLMQSYPIKDVPLNIRPGMVFVTAAWILLLGVLGMAPIPSLPINDKALHFFGFGFATFLIYFIIEVSPDTQTWHYQHAPLLLTLLICFFFGGIISEYVQSMLPWKTFQYGDIIANLLGASVFLYLARLASKRTSMYLPLSPDADSVEV